MAQISELIHLPDRVTWRTPCFGSAKGTVASQRHRKAIPTPQLGPFRAAPSCSWLPGPAGALDAALPLRYTPFAP
jgi:hypothetical protein